MKLKYFLILSILVFLVSCSSVRVTSDYDTKTDFTTYKTFAFYKNGIDKAQISDLDKKRIMRAIEFELKAKGMTISETPDILVSLFTKSRERFIDDGFYGGFYGGMGYPWYYGAGYQQNFSTYTEGTLFIDMLEAENKSLVWQGVGTGALTTRRTPEQKEKRINEFVKNIMAKYPPKLGKK